MNVHKNARTCPASRELLFKRVSEQGWSVQEASEAAGISGRRGREWGRRARSAEPLTDRSSKPHHSRTIAPSIRDRVIQLRQERRTMQQIAAVAKISISSVGRICRTAGPSRLKNLEPAGTTIRYERDELGELLHVDTKRLGRFDRVGHRITRKRSFGSKKQGFEFVYVAAGDASRRSYVEILADERSEAACEFLSNAVSWFAKQNVRVERVMTDNDSAFGFRPFREHCDGVGVRHKRIRPYMPRTNGKAERFIQTLLREWAYRFTYESSAERWLTPYVHF